MNKIKFAFLIILFSLAVGNIFAKDNSFLQPDSLYIDLFDVIWSPKAKKFTIISVQYKNGKGTVYSYGLDEYSKLNKQKEDSTIIRKGNLSKENVDKIIKYLFKESINKIKSNQFKKNFNTIPSKTGTGGLKVVIKKGNKIFKKEIRYPKPLNIALQKEFANFYIQLQFVIYHLTKPLSSKELLALYNNPLIANLGVNFYDLQDLIRHSLKIIKDTSKTSDINRNLEARIKNNKFASIVGPSLSRALYENNPKMYYNFLDSLFINMQNNKRLKRRIFKYIQVIDDKDSNKVFYMKKFIHLDNKKRIYERICELKAATYLLNRCDDKKIYDILVNYFNDNTYMWLHEISKKLREKNNKKLIFLLEKSYLLQKKSYEKDKNKKTLRILVKDLFLLNNLLKRKGKENNSVHYYFKNFKQESEELEKFLKKRKTNY